MDNFDLESYLNERLNIYNKNEKKYLDNYKKLLKKYNILFEYYLGDALGFPISTLIIFDSPKDNVLNIDSNSKIYKCTISEEDLNTIKGYLSNDMLFMDGETPKSNLLDGTTHTINILSDDKFKSIKVLNLWYWYFDKNVLDTDALEEEKKYTKLLINLIDDIAEVLNKYDIKIELDYDEGE